MLYSLPPKPKIKNQNPIPQTTSPQSPVSNIVNSTTLLNHLINQIKPKQVINHPHPIVSNKNLTPFCFLKLPLFSFLFSSVPFSFLINSFLFSLSPFFSNSSSSYFFFFACSYHYLLFFLFY